MNMGARSKVRASLSAIVLRADGRREDLGVIATTHAGRVHVARLVTPRITKFGPKKEN